MWFVILPQCDFLEAVDAFLALPVPILVNDRNFRNESIVSICVYTVVIPEQVTLEAYSVNLDRLWFEIQPTLKFYRHQFWKVPY